MNKRTSLCLAAVVIFLGATAVADNAATADSSVRNSWVGFPEGAWVTFDWSEQWGSNPATVEPRRMILTEHRSIGTSLTETQRQEGGAWKRVMGGLHGAYPPDGEGMALVSETLDNVVVAGTPSSCTRREYVHDESDGSRQRLVLWHCRGIELTNRVLPQWSVSFGWQLEPDVARALIERRDTAGVITSVEMELDATQETVSINGRAIACFRERLDWRHRLAGQHEGRVVKQTTRWLSSDVPGLVARQVDDNMMGRVSRFQVTDFGTQAIASNK